MPHEITLTSKLGVFTFDSDVILAHAKIIRDAVTAQFFNPQNGIKIRSEADAERFVQNHLGQTLAEIGFDVEIRPT